MANSEAKGKINTLIILATLGGLAIGLIIGMTVAKITQPSSSNSLTDSQKMPGSQIDESIYNDQSALINAKVKTVSPTSITVENYQNKTATFPLTDKVFLNKQSSNQKSATGTINDIKVGEFVVLTLKKSQGEYQVYSILIPPPLGTPPPPPVSTIKPIATPQASVTPTR